VELLGAPAERTDDAAGCAIALEGEQVARPRGEELRQGVLEERQRAWLVMHVRKDVGDEACLEADADGARRALDRLGELVLGGGGHRHHAGSEQLAELRVAAGGRGSPRDVTTTRTGARSAASAVSPSGNGAVLVGRR
jgi:hypothetical protein